MEASGTLGLKRDYSHVSQVPRTLRSLVPSLQTSPGLKQCSWNKNLGEVYIMKIRLEVRGLVSIKARGRRKGLQIST